jgi:hypothetical protein
MSRRTDLAALSAVLLVLVQIDALAATIGLANRALRVRRPPEEQRAAAEEEKARDE